MRFWRAVEHFIFFALFTLLIIAILGLLGYIQFSEEDWNRAEENVAKEIGEGVICVCYEANETIRGTIQENVTVDLYFKGENYYEN